MMRTQDGSLTMADSNSLFKSLENSSDSSKKKQVFRDIIVKTDLF